MGVTARLSDSSWQKRRGLRSDWVPGPHSKAQNSSSSIHPPILSFIAYFLRQPGCQSLCEALENQTLVSLDTNLEPSIQKKREWFKNIYPGGKGWDIYSGGKGKEPMRGCGPGSDWETRGISQAKGKVRRAFQEEGIVYAKAGAWQYPRCLGNHMQITGVEH